MDVKKKVIQLFKIYEGVVNGKHESLIFLESLEADYNKLGCKPELYEIDLNNIPLLKQLNDCLEKLGDIKVLVFDKGDNTFFGELEKVIHSDEKIYGRDLVVRVFGNQNNFYLLDNEIKRLYFLGCEISTDKRVDS